MSFKILILKQTKKEQCNDLIYSYNYQIIIFKN